MTPEPIFDLAHLGHMEMLTPKPDESLKFFVDVMGMTVSGRKGEYVRATSTIVDGYLHSIMFHALSQLSNNLRDFGYDRPMLVIHNSGGMAQMNSTDALQTIHSGPIAGVGAAEHLSNETGVGNLISTDMGGTSFDIGLVPEGGVKHYDFLPTIDRWLVSVPMVHLDTLGAGGGSIAGYDRIHNSVKIGPQSAGSNPGPACYDRGGLKPTVTDADLVLGYFDPDNYANGYIKLNPKRARFAIEENLCDHLDMDVIEVARVIKDGVDEQMAIGIGKELRVRGYLPEDFTMLAYGGNGPLHACGIARHAGIKRVLAPPFSSVFSACGAGNMRQLHFHERGVHVTLYNATTRALYDDYAEINAVIEDLEAKGREDLVRQGFAGDDVKFRLELDMRYGNQLLTQAVALEDLTRVSGVGDVLDIIKTFGDVYSHRFGAASAAPEAGIRCNTVRVAAFVDGDVVNFDALESGGERTVPDPVGHRKAYFIGHDKAIDTPVYNDAALTADRVIPGPAIVTTETTTFLVEPTWRLEPTKQGAVWFLQD